MTESNLRIGVRSQTPTENVPKTIGTSEPSRELNHGELRQLRRALQRPPRQFGYSVTAWTRQLVQDYIHERFDVTYSLQFIDRLVKAVGVAHRLEGWDV
jgi:transposase